MSQPRSPYSGWRAVVHDVIFHHDTPPSKAFDVVLIVTIILSVVAVMLESMSGVRARFGPQLRVAEWVFTILFTIEYVLRIICVGRSWRYVRSFFGIVDLLAIIPTYLSLVFPGAQALTAIRLLRILRVFRILKLVQYISEAAVLIRALRDSQRKVTVFVFTVFTLVSILGSLMYFIEGAENGFTSIPKSIYWAIVTLTTVGYGDISPRTNLGQSLAALVMVLGYSIIAVPTGIVTAELTRAGAGSRMSTRNCAACGRSGLDPDSRFCKHCGRPMSWEGTPAQTHQRDKETS